MAEDTIRENTYCCGGGGGLLTDDLIELRVKGAKPRMEALNQVTKDKGVTHMAAICAICKTQFSKVMPYYGFRMDQIVSVHQLVSNAIIIDDHKMDGQVNNNLDNLKKLKKLSASRTGRRAKGKRAATLKGRAARRCWISALGAVSGGLGQAVMVKTKWRGQGG